MNIFEHPYIEMYEALKYSPTVKCKVDPSPSASFSYHIVTQAFSQLFSVYICQKIIQHLMILLAD